MSRFFLIFIVLIISCRAKEKANQSDLILDSVVDRGNKKPEDVFPFNKCDKIELVSYKNRVRYARIPNNELITDGKFIVPNIQKRVFLDKAQSDSLFLILYNTSMQDDSVAYADCYDPQHAVVFYRRDSAIAFYEVCFSCHRSVRSKNIEFAELGNEKYCVLGRFFINNKIGLLETEDQFQFECLQFEKQ